MSDRPWLDVSALHPGEGVQHMVLEAARQGLRPTRVLVADYTMLSLLLAAGKTTTTCIEDENGVALVMWTVVGQVVVRIGRNLKNGEGLLCCEGDTPSEKKVWFAT